MPTRVLAGRFRPASASKLGTRAGWLADHLKACLTARFTVVFVTHSVFESVFLSNRIIVMAAKPGRVFGEMAVDAPYPRDEAFRTSEDYAHLTRAASTMLRAAMGLKPGEQDHVLH